jgi:hypothetical protein
MVCTAGIPGRLLTRLSDSPPDSHAQILLPSSFVYLVGRPILRGFLADLRTGFFAGLFLATGFFTGFFAAAFFAGAFFGAGFLAVVFLATGFLAGAAFAVDLGFLVAAMTILKKTFPPHYYQTTTKNRLHPKPFSFCAMVGLVY